MIRTAEIKYTEYWLIRVIENGISNKKLVVKEIEYSTEPTEQDILEVLLKCNADEFISVAHNYRM
jgi:hypothetical protein